MVPSPRRPTRIRKSWPTSPTAARRASDERRAAVRLREIARENQEARREQERLDSEQQRRDQERADLVYQTTQEPADYEDFVDTRDLRYGTVHPGNVILVDDPIGELFNRGDFTIIRRTAPTTPVTPAVPVAPVFGNTGGLGRRPRTTRTRGVSSYRIPPLFFSTFDPSRRSLAEVNHASLTERTECPICRVDMREGGESVVALPCHPAHVYHRECVVSWLRSVPTCPLCSANLEDVDIDA